MAIKKVPFTFLEDFQVIPMESGSFMVEQGLTFSRGFTNLEQVVDFLILEKERFLKSFPTTTEGNYGYEHYDRTGTPDYGKEDDE